MQSRALRATLVAAPLSVLATCLEWDDLRAVELPMILCWAVAIWAVARVLEARDSSPERLTVALGAMVVAPLLLGHVFLDRHAPLAGLLGALALLVLVLLRERRAGTVLGSALLAAAFAVAGFRDDAARTLPDVLGHAWLLVAAIALVAVAWAYRRGRPADERLLTALAAAAVAATLCSQALSPQSLAWLVPLVALARERRALPLLLLALPLTQVVVHWRGEGEGVPAWTVWLLAGRTVLLVALLAVLVDGLRRRAE